MGTKNITEKLIGLNLNTTVSEAVDSARESAEKIPIFAETGNGAIVLMAVPLCREADVWLGNLSTCNLDGDVLDAHEYIAVRTIRPGGSHTIQWTDPDNGHAEPVNCLAYAMAKIAYLSHLVKEDIPSRDDDEHKDEFLEANGYSWHKGAVCITVYYGGKAVLRFYIVFSGATEDEDQRCANRTTKLFVDYLKEILGDEFKFHKQTVEGRTWLNEEK